MNKLLAQITQIQQSDSIMLVDAQIDNQVFSALLIDSLQNMQWLTVGAQVDLLFKETEVSIAKNFSGLISFRNKIEARIAHIDSGTLLSIIRLQTDTFSFNSAITSRAVAQLQLQVGDVVTALIKANEVAITVRME